MKMDKIEEIMSFEAFSKLWTLDNSKTEMRYYRCNHFRNAQGERIPQISYSNFGKSYQVVYSKFNGTCTLLELVKRGSQNARYEQNGWALPIGIDRCFNTLSDAKRHIYNISIVGIKPLLKLSLSKMLEIAQNDNKTAIKALMSKIEKKGLGNIRKQREYETINHNVYWSGILKHSLNKILNIAKSNNKTKIQQLINKL